VNWIYPKKASRKNWSKDIFNPETGKAVIEKRWKKGEIPSASADVTLSELPEPKSEKGKTAQQIAKKVGRLRDFLLALSKDFRFSGPGNLCQLLWIF
ncbi:MAG: hypothetical protein WA667_02230, partial [Candidatus Nitrosopolaris sp.]